MKPRSAKPVRHERPSGKVLRALPVWRDGDVIDAEGPGVSPRATVTLHTPRLHLRSWREEDREPFAAINADPRVARCLPATLNRSQSDAFYARIQDGFARHGFGLWAVEKLDPPAASFIGFVGLSVPRFSAHFTPCVEIGWRLAPTHWNRGLATEGARAVLRHAFDDLGLDEIVSFTVPTNAPSRRVMEKIGLRHDPADDFDHPSLPPGHPLARHVLYRLARSGALSGEATGRPPQ